MSKKTLTWLLIFSIIINISTLASYSYHRWLKPDRRSHRSFRSSHREALSKKLGLTEQQAQQVRELRSELWETIKPLRAQLHEERCKFMQEIKRDTVNIDEIYQSINRISEIQKQMQLKSVENMLAHQSILTPEQRKKFFELMSKRMQIEGSKRRHRPRLKTEDEPPGKK